MTAEEAKKKVDIYRDTPVRYLGYANEVGEAFRSMIGHKWVAATYGVSTLYVLADTYDKTNEMYNRNKNDGQLMKKTTYVAVDTLIWQLLASVIVPGFTINRTCKFVNAMLKKNERLPLHVRKWIVTGIGLSAIPFIIRPIDHLVDAVLDGTLRKFAP